MQRIYWVGALFLLSLCLLAPFPAAAQTATPAGVQPSTYTATVKTNGVKRLRVRSGPGLNYRILTRILNGQQYPAIARDASSRWVQISLPNGPVTNGWVSAAYVTLDGPLASLPVAIARATPAATPAASPGEVAQPRSGKQPALAGRLAVPVFDAERGTYDIYTVNADGSDLRQAVTQASSPALSDDGTKLAYRHWQTDDRGIVVANSDGSSPFRLTDKLEDVLPSFSPDGRQIAFSSYRHGDRRSRLYYVWSDEQNLTAWEWGSGGLFGADPDWTAGNQIVFHGERPVDELWMVNPDGSAPWRIFAGETALSLSVAPDSRTIAFMADVDGNWDVYAVEVDGSNLRRLTFDEAQDGLPAWSPDGQSIAFASNRNGQWGLWVMNADGSNQRLLALLPGSVDGSVQFEPDYLNHGWLEEQIAWSR